MEQVYYVANYLDVIDCLDRKRTDVIDDWEPINDLGDVGIITPVLSRRNIGDSVLFRVRHNSNMVVVREDVKDHLERSQVSGCVFARCQTSD